MSRIETRLQRIERELDRKRPRGVVVQWGDGHLTGDVDDPDAILVVVTYEGSEPDEIEGEGRNEH